MDRYTYKVTTTTRLPGVTPHDWYSGPDAAAAIHMFLSMRASHYRLVQSGGHDWDVGYVLRLLRLSDSEYQEVVVFSSSNF